VRLIQHIFLRDKKWFIASDREWNSARPCLSVPHIHCIDWRFRRVHCDGRVAGTPVAPDGAHGMLDACGDQRWLAGGRLFQRVAQRVAQIGDGGNVTGDALSFEDEVVIVSGNELRKPDMLGNGCSDPAR
jgi:hypothetical protein